MELIEIVKEISAICIIIASIAGGVAVIVKILKYYGEQRDFKQKCESYADEISELNKKIDKISEEENKKIENAHNFAREELSNMQIETDSKLQEIRAEQCMIAYCMLATLDGLKQLGCNGKVTEARNTLDKHLNKQAHGVNT